MSDTPFRKIAILGTGLIGGSFGLAVRATGARVIGWDKPEVLARARAMGAIDDAAADVATALRDADLIVMALPIGATIELLKTVAAHASDAAFVTDVCSTKALICENAAKLFQRGARFLGGHPMAGREAGGIENASPHLFRGTKYALIADEADEDPRLKAFAKLVRTLGAEPAFMNAQTHDWAAAIVSHLPQLASVALASVLQDETGEAGLPLALAGPGLRDALRLAGSPYDVWRDVFHTNADNIGAALDRLITALDHLRNDLKTRELENEFTAANEVYKTLRGMK